ncbi:Reverse transcriptase zinc-binding domain [Dillenia turbinata]|uniref:Reverse transcriptase zinc-binding domain n=1 Tax=Dillenia turbinata TaxID=194707 RepID=A0AAN8VNZ7_9MAGN
MDNLVKIHVDADPTCLVCKDAEESAAHVLINCPVCRQKSQWVGEAIWFKALRIGVSIDEYIHIP